MRARRAGHEAAPSGPGMAIRRVLAEISSIWPAMLGPVSKRDASRLALVQAARKIAIIGNEWPRHLAAECLFDQRDDGPPLRSRKANVLSDLRAYHRYVLNRQMCQRTWRPSSAASASAPQALIGGCGRRYKALRAPR